MNNYEQTTRLRIHGDSQIRNGYSCRSLTHCSFDPERSPWICSHAEKQQQAHATHEPCSLAQLKNQTLWLSLISFSRSQSIVPATQNHASDFQSEVPAYCKCHAKRAVFTCTPKKPDTLIIFDFLPPVTKYCACHAKPRVRLKVANQKSQCTVNAVRNEPCSMSPISPRLPNKRRMNFGTVTWQCWAE